MDHQDTVFFVCSTCYTQLTAALLTVPSSFVPNLADGAPLVPSDYVWKTAEDFHWHLEGDQHIGGFALNVKDATFTQPGTEESRKGCCGPSGGYGLNRTCANGHLVGLEVADCWTPHFLLFPQEKVQVFVLAKK